MKWLIKKISKILLVLFIFNTICFGSFISWISFSVIHPALSNNNLKFSDLIFNKNMSKDQLSKIQGDINKNSSSLGKASADNLLIFLNSFFDKKEINFSSKPSVNISPSYNDEVIQQNDKNAQEGLKQGLTISSKSY